MRLLVFDSGVGGLSVVREIRKALPAAAVTYLADTAVFPYGDLYPDILVERVTSLMDVAIPLIEPAAVVIACNTASTLVLPPLRAKWDIPFVGTVPAVKPAAEQSRSRMVSVLATPGTVKRDYTHDLIARYGGDCRFTLVGSATLASLVEKDLSGRPVDDDAYAAEIAPCFVQADGRRTDTIVLACTHYPLVLNRLARVAAWEVAWIDPAPAIARQVVVVTREAADDQERGDRFLATGPLPAPELVDHFGFPKPERLRISPG